MSEETMNQNTEQKPTNSNPEDKNGDPGSGRTFTQEEVNRYCSRQAGEGKS